MDVGQKIWPPMERHSDCGGGHDVRFFRHERVDGNSQFERQNLRVNPKEIR